VLSTHLLKKRTNKTKKVGKKLLTPHQTTATAIITTIIVRLSIRTPPPI